MADLMDKIDILKLKEILEEKDMKFTVADINALMDAELEKSPEEMNTDLVDLCADVLNDVYEKREKTSAKRKVKVRKILLVAAVAALLSAVAIPACARFMPSEAADKIVDFCYDHFKINLRDEEDTSAPYAGEGKLVNGLILESLHTLKLPEVLLSDEYEKSVQTEESDLLETIYIDFSNVGTQISGSVMVTQYKNDKVEIGNGVGNVSGMYKYFKQITASDTDILVFGDDKKIYIKYVELNTEYEISLLNTEFETAVEIAETIKS